MRIYYTLTTKTSVILSQSHATTNNHECLDYIPGSTILGALASQHYGDLSSAESWQLFHSGRCRFSPCYPLCHGEIALPLPLSWHIEKGRAWIEQSEPLQCNLLDIYNHAAGDFQQSPGNQRQQLRSGYITTQGKVASVKRGVTTRTALNAQRRAKEGALFSYAYIEPGQTFVGWIDAEDRQLLNPLMGSLQQELRIGRSRNSEFGQVQLQTVDTPELPRVENRQQELVVWCLSDCEFINLVGMPTLSPSAADIHPLLCGHLDRKRSFIRTQRLRRFNQQRQGLDSEQWLISKGSVLTYTLEQPISDEVLQEIEHKGTGLNRQQGLGWVTLNPSWSHYSALPKDELFHSWVITLPNKNIPQTEAEEAPYSPLMQWVAEQQQRQQLQQQDQQDAECLLQEVVSSYRQARSYNKISLRHQAGPSMTQWRRIEAVVKYSKNDQSWQQSLFDGENAICKSINDLLGWGISWSDEHNCVKSFASHLQQLVAQRPRSVMLLLLEKVSKQDLSTAEGLEQVKKISVEERTS
ncbi:hypothetical protein C9426_32695 [Serratia sp. S1B]|nr:hypothetical protein C9426_32695 [Serratia sp. S1B]